jgi:hypothetical protein
MADHCAVIVICFAFCKSFSLRVPHTKRHVTLECFRICSSVALEAKCVLSSVRYESEIVFYLKYKKISAFMRATLPTICASLLRHSIIIVEHQKLVKNPIIIAATFLAELRALEHFFDKFLEASCLIMINH